MRVKKRRAVFQLYIRLRDIEPAIWRHIHVWEDIKLHKEWEAIYEKVAALHESYADGPDYPAANAPSGVGIVGAELFGCH
ncbi:MAG: hypothetical protein JST11_02045 [Acidobacteria bacterium]|nr:hypothetical protein [Acidobacteriota bacterium]